MEAGRRRDPIVKHNPYFMNINVTSVTKRLHPAIRKEVPTAIRKERNLYRGDITFPRRTLKGTHKGFRGF